MAQAAVRPEISADSDTPGLANADEMLAQLAGSEIDRLLAEADAGGNDPSANPSPNNPFAESPAAETNSAPSPLEELPIDLQSPAIPGDSMEDQAALSGELDQLFKQLQQDVAEKPKLAEKSAEPPAPPAIQAISESPVETLAETAPPVEPALAQESEKSDAETQGEERAALLEAAGFNTATLTAETPNSAAAPMADAPSPAAEAPAATPIAAAPAPAVPAPAAPVDAGPVPNASEKNAVLSAAGFETADVDQKSSLGKKSVTILIKPLEWVNAPIESCPVAVRAAIGRAAIVTLVNAVLVLGYVLMFRKH